MKRIDIVKKDKKWISESSKRIIATAKTKEAIIRKTAKIAKADKEAVTVKIHKLGGKIQEERTYPRSADPSQSPG